MILKEEKQKYIYEKLKKFEKNNGVKVIIAAYGGSKSIGTNGNSSDDDVYIIYDDDDKRLPFRVSTDDIDHPICGKNIILDSLNDYMRRDIKYPTFFTRSKEEAEFNKGLTQYEREDYPRSLIYYTLLGDNIWLLNYSIEQVYDLYKAGLRKIDVLDFYYTKACANYFGTIQGRDKCNVRKYLIVIQELLYCRFICEKEVNPPMHLDDLLSEYDKLIDDSLKKEIDELRVHNRDAKVAKEQNCIMSKALINEFIEGQIEFIRGYFNDVRDAVFDVPSNDSYKNIVM